MRNIRRSGVTAVTAAIALALGAVPVALTVPAIVASGENSTTLTPASVSAGQVVLTTTSSVGRITYGTQVQEFTGGQQCQVAPIGNPPNLLAITGSVGTGQAGVAGFRDGAIGVFETSSIDPNNASQCARVDAGSFTSVESLTLALPAATYPDAPFSDRLLAENATVNASVANSRSGIMTIELLKAGTVVKSTPAPWNNRKAGDVIAIPAGSLQVAGNYTAIRLTASAGAFSLRGASLSLVSQAAAEFCPTAFYRDPARPTTKVTYVNQTGSCFGISLSSGPRFVQFLKPPTVSPNAQFRFNVDWTLPNDGTPDAVIPDSFIDFEIPAPDPANAKALPFCSDFTAVVDIAENAILTRDSGGNLKIDNFSGYLASQAFVDFEPASTEKEWGCIDTRSSDVTASNIVVHDTIFVIGDLRMTLGK